jgi:hypothetical protein
MMHAVNALFYRFAACIGGGLLLFSGPLSAQEPQPPREVHEHVSVTAPLLTPTRDASGTGWLPDATPMYGVHREWSSWEVRVNGAIFMQALFEPRDRHRTGGSQTRQVVSTNWGMLMARRSVAGGRFGVRTMISAEPWTVSRCGSLNFLAVGERCGDETVHDRQQPHDLRAPVTRGMVMANLCRFIGRARVRASRLPTSTLGTRQSKRSSHASLAGLDTCDFRRDNRRRT